MTEVQSSTYSKQRIRYAVMALFIAQGLCFASWASRLPDIKKDFNVESYLHYGLLMFLIPIGKFIAIPLVGFLLPRIGSKKTVFISIVGYTISLFIVGLVSGITGLGITMFLFGIFWNMTDISLNTQAIEVERIYGRPIIATFHASWSLAACIGALIGYGMINLGIGTFYHFLGMTVLAMIMILINYKYLQEQSPIPVAEKAEEKLDVQPKKKGLHMPETLLIQLGLIWLLALIVENTMFEWSDVYFQSVIKAPESLQVGFLVFMIMMFSGRMLTNYAYRIWQKKNSLTDSGSIDSSWFYNVFPFYSLFRCSNHKGYYKLYRFYAYRARDIMCCTNII